MFLRKNHLPRKILQWLWKSVFTICLWTTSFRSIYLTIKLIRTIYFLLRSKRDTFYALDCLAFIRLERTWEFCIWKQSRHSYKGPSYKEEHIHWRLKGGQHCNYHLLIRETSFIHDFLLCLSMRKDLTEILVISSPSHVKRSSIHSFISTLLTYT